MGPTSRPESIATAVGVPGGGRRPHRGPMNWNRLYEALAADPDQLAAPGVVRLLEARLRQIEAAQDRLEQEALRCDRLLDVADDLRDNASPGG